MKKNLVCIKSIDHTTINSKYPKIASTHEGYFAIRANFHFEMTTISVRLKITPRSHVPCVFALCEFVLHDNFRLHFYEKYATTMSWLRAKLTFIA